MDKFQEVNLDWLDVYNMPRIMVEYVIEYAKEFWEYSPSDFCIQIVTDDAIVFGSVNRVVWHIRTGFSLEESHCTQGFIKHYKEKRGG